MTATARRYHRIRYCLYFASSGIAAAVLLVLHGTPLASSIAGVSSRIFPDAFALQVLTVVFCTNIILTAAGFPLKAYGGYFLEREYGLSSESFGHWLKDASKSFVLAFAFSLAMVEAFYAAVLLWPGAWWIAFGAVWIAAVLVLSAIFPSLIVPLFFPMKPLAEGPARDRILGLAAKLGIGVKGVYEIALSRKTRKANAGVLGIGPFRRIVMGDTLLGAFSADEIDVVLSHEIGHYVRRHNRLSLAVHLGGGLAGIFVFYIASGALVRLLGGDGLADLGVYPGLVLMAGSFQAVFVPFLNAFSRRLEREADAFALQTTRSRASFVSAMRKLGEQNLADLDPHPLIEWLLFSHPSITRRIRYAETAELN